VQRFEKRDLAYPLKHLNSAYFVNFIFEVDSQLVDKLRAKLKLDEDVALQNYLRLPQKKKAAEAAA
ncbi:MAG: 30S ribosomal protein S6, partial [Terrimicrobiaceae bacterium]